MKDIIEGKRPRTTAVNAPEKGVEQQIEEVNPEALQTKHQGEDVFVAPIKGEIKPNPAMPDPNNFQPSNNGPKKK